MRSIFGILCMAIAAVLVFPALSVSLFSPPAPAEPQEIYVRLYLNDEDRLLEQPLEEYVVGVVAAEMPASFHKEALKAQAVAARTYAVARLRQYGGRGCAAHPEADLCSDPTTDQAWISDEAMRERWGPLGYPWYHHRVSQAVWQTRGEVLTYGSDLIDAVYHSTSGGRTENAEAVWGEPVPYLLSVPSEFEDHAPKAATRRSFRLNELALLLEIPPADVRRTVREGLPPVQVLARSPAGRALRVSVGGHDRGGRELRQLLDLPSTWFDVTAESGWVHFDLRGFGHGVGLSQYGADGMAAAGHDYRQILHHYYQGVQIQRLVLHA